MKLKDWHEAHFAVSLARTQMYQAKKKLEDLGVTVIFSVEDHAEPLLKALDRAGAKVSYDAFIAPGADHEAYSIEVNVGGNKSMCVGTIGTHEIDDIMTKNGEWPFEDLPNHNQGEILKALHRLIYKRLVAHDFMIWSASEVNSVMRATLEPGGIQMSCPTFRVQYTGSTRRMPSVAW